MSLGAARVFVSSTFQDMHEERDVLSRRVFAVLRQRFLVRGVSVSEIDLRWGVTTEDVSERGVLPVCLDEIDRCRPFFIGLLGGRYGWVGPAAGELLRRRYPHLDAYAERSVTELERIFPRFS
jgi:hypothetical protein